MPQICTSLYKDSKCEEKREKLQKNVNLKLRQQFRVSKWLAKQRKIKASNAEVNPTATYLTTKVTAQYTPTFFTNNLSLPTFHLRLYKLSSIKKTASTFCCPHLFCLPWIYPQYPTGTHAAGFNVIARNRLTIMN